MTDIENWFNNIDLTDTTIHVVFEKGNSLSMISCLANIVIPSYQPKDNSGSIWSDLHNVIKCHKYDHPNNKEIYALVMQYHDGSISIVADNKSLKYRVS